MEIEKIVENLESLSSKELKDFLCFAYLPYSHEGVIRDDDIRGIFKVKDADKFAEVYVRKGLISKVNKGYTIDESIGSYLFGIIHEENPMPKTNQ